MPRERRYRAPSRELEAVEYIFEIKSWRPSYLIAVTRDGSREAPHDEYLSLHLEARCLSPKVVSGRLVEIEIKGTRDVADPLLSADYPDREPKRIGVLALPAHGGQFSMYIPHDSFRCLLSGLAARVFCYITLLGQPLREGRAACIAASLDHSIEREAV